jgi:hypothetical protein
MAVKEDYENLLVEIKKEFSDFDVVVKTDSILMKIIDVCLRILTFNQMNKFMTKFITTLGNTVYVPADWEQHSLVGKVEIMRHERIHMKQSRELGRLKFSLFYLFFPMPFGLAYYRMKFEKEAYEESLKAVYEYYGSKFFTPSLKSGIVNHFISAEYFWMWLRKSDIEKWYDNVISCITKIS